MNQKENPDWFSTRTFLCVFETDSSMQIFPFSIVFVRCMSTPRLATSVSVVRPSLARAPNIKYPWDKRAPRHDRRRFAIDPPDSDGWINVRHPKGSRQGNPTGNPIQNPNPELLWLRIGCFTARFLRAWFTHHLVRVMDLLNWTEWCIAVWCNCNHIALKESAVSIACASMLMLMLTLLSRAKPSIFWLDIIGQENVRFSCFFLYRSTINVIKIYLNCVFLRKR